MLIVSVIRTWIYDPQLCFLVIVRMMKVTRLSNGCVLFPTGKHEEKQDEGGIVTKNFTKKIQ